MKHLIKYILKNYPNALQEFVTAEQQISYCPNLQEFAWWKCSYIRTLAKKDLTQKEMAHIDYCFSDMESYSTIRAEHLVGLALDQLLEQQ